MRTKVEVSIITITYNQELYVREALESICKQNTDFNFEVIVADDCSTDKTPKIIKGYAQKYPKIINPILRKRNLGAWSNFTDALNKAKGKYIAICEGDDYWTDPNKLQCQVDLLEKHPDYALCFHPVKVIFKNNEQKEFIYPDSSDINQFTINELLKKNFIQTNSVMYKKQSYKNLATNVMPGDWYLHLYHAQFGKIGFINKVMSVYRRHPGGIWWKDEENKIEFWKKNAVEHLNFYDKVKELVNKNDEYINEITESIDSFIDMVITDCGTNYDNNVLEQMVSKYPECIKAYMHKTLLDKRLLINETEGQKSEILQARNELLNKDVIQKRLDQAESQLAAIRGSRGWKVLNLLYTTKHKLKIKK